MCLRGEERVGVEAVESMRKGRWEEVEDGVSMLAGAFCFLVGVLGVLLKR